jgi:hypothetical protein
MIDEFQSNENFGSTTGLFAPIPSLPTLMTFIHANIADFAEKKPILLSSCKDPKLLFYIYL